MEYEAHKRELLAQLEFYNRQTQYLQIFSVAAAAVIAVLLRFPPLGPSSPQVAVAQSAAPLTIPEPVLWGFLIVGAAMAFFLASAALAPTYMFFILRGRLSQLEARINELLDAPNLLTYEYSVANHFLGRSMYAPDAFTPHVIFGFWRVATLVLVSLALVLVAFWQTDKGLALAYAAVLSVCTFWQLKAHFSLYAGAGRRAIERFYSEEAGPPEGGNPFLVLSNILLSLLLAGGIACLAHYWPAIRAFPQAAADPQQLLCRQPVPILVLLVAAYNLLCGTVLPLLSEAPLLLYPCVSLGLIIAASAVGKAVGAVCLHSLRSVVARLVGGTVLGRMFVLPTRLESLVRRHGFRGFLLLQSVPFMPMRSSVVAYSMLGGTVGRIALGAAVGTVSRNVLIGGAAWLGLMSLRALLQ